jgi:hypothetical protein
MVSDSVSATDHLQHFLRPTVLVARMNGGISRIIEKAQAAFLPRPSPCFVLRSARNTVGLTISNPLSPGRPFFTRHHTSASQRATQRV